MDDGSIRELFEIREGRIRNALRVQHNEGRIYAADELFMLDMLQRGVVGMDGFKFCRLEEAKENRSLTLRQLARMEI